MYVIEGYTRMNQVQLRLADAVVEPKEDRQVSLGRRLIQSGAIAPWQLFFSLERQSRWDATLGEILLAKSWINEDQLLDAYATYYSAQRVDLNRIPPSKSLTGLIDPNLCLKHSIIPWMRLGSTVILATSRPDRVDAMQAELPEELRHAPIAIAPQEQITGIVTKTHRSALLNLAETRVSDVESCRSWGKKLDARLWITLAILGSLLGAFLFAPKVITSILTLWALFTLICAGLLKYSAFFSQLHMKRQPEKTLPEDILQLGKLPRISVLVPLFREKEIASALIRRLSKLTYPKALLDVILVLEEHDDLTHETIARTDLPDWISVVEAPKGSGLTTKPRALNYALDFCRGEIIGIWDAEDAPAPDQLEKIAARFSTVPKDVVCLQGILDYYNPYDSWISRCFTIEYSTWFRVVLPGLSHMGLAIPLGGTTLFMRRDALEEVGGWDAHNVTEDADLGIRLARYGYRTELIETVTREEANYRPWPWVRQRSRWLKGYMVTYLVHMRNPWLLLKQLGWRQFLGVHAIFVTTLSQFLLAPLIWTFWMVPFGANHTLANLMGEGAGWAVAGLFLSVFFADLLISLVAVSGQGRRRLMPFAATLWLYFPLATIAVYKGLFELVFRPFFWDKTEHGHAQESADLT